MMKIPAGPRFKYGWVVFLASLVTLSLVSCATVRELATKSPIAEPATQAPAPVEPATQAPAATVSNTPIPAPTTGISVVVGFVKEVAGDAISVQTLEGATSVQLTADSVIQEFAASSLQDLAIGQRVTAMGRVPGCPADS